MSTIDDVSTRDPNFEQRMRKAIVNSALALNRSRMAFRVFRKSKCNEAYWERTREGGFLLRRDASPAAAIRDIFNNGSQYGTECATAMVIVYYGAVLEIFPEQLFNRLFSQIYLMNWGHLDSDIGIRSYSRVPEFLPGDCMYFKNPDVDPTTPEWQGENVIDLGNGTYYGHGIGIQNAEGIIRALNSHRISGSTTSAYLLDSAKRPDFRNLERKLNNFSPRAVDEESSSVVYIPAY